MAPAPGRRRRGHLGVERSPPRIYLIQNILVCGSTTCAVVDGYVYGILDVYSTLTCPNEFKYGSIIMCNTLSPHTKYRFMFNVVSFTEKRIRPTSTGGRTSRGDACGGSDHYTVLTYMLSLSKLYLPSVMWSDYSYYSSHFTRLQLCTLFSGV